MTIESSGRQIQENFTFTCPLIIHFINVHFFFQILHVYVSKYECGGQFWPIVHNTTIFSLVLTQIIALGVFGIKQSPVASGFTIPLIFFTLLFNEYCRQRFSPVFKSSPAQVSIRNLSIQKAPQPFFWCDVLFVQVLIEMDRQDEQWGRTEEIYSRLRSAYCQFPLITHDVPTVGNSHQEDQESSQDPESLKPGTTVMVLGGSFHGESISD